MLKQEGKQTTETRHNLQKIRSILEEALGIAAARERKLKDERLRLHQEREVERFLAEVGPVIGPRGKPPQSQPTVFEGQALHGIQGRKARLKSRRLSRNHDPSAIESLIDKL